MTFFGAQRQTGPDRILLIVVLALVTWGLLNVYSVSQQLEGGPLRNLSRQLGFVAVGLFFMVGLARLNLAALNNRKVVLTILGVMAFLLVLVLFVGEERNGARRWLLVGSVALQPGEFAKAAVVIYFAHHLATVGEKIRDLREGIAPMFVVAVVFAGLLGAEPDLGSAAVVFMMLFAMYYLGGAPKRYLAAFVVFALVAAVAVVSVKPHAMKRITGFTDDSPEAIKGVNWQQHQAKIAVGLGGWFGVGYNSGWQKAHYVPEMHNDFILANIGEEHGLVGLAGVFVLFGVLVWRSVRLTARARDPFSRFVGIGAATLVGLQVLVNAGVTMSLLPNKGLSLPWFSVGGSNTVLNFILMGLVLSAARTREVEVSSRKRVMHLLARRQLADATGE